MKHTCNNGLLVRRKNGEPFEILMKRFKKKVMNSKMIQEVKMRESFEKPSERKNRKQRESIRRLEKKKRRIRR